MKYTIEIEINLPRDRVVELFNSETYIFEWMEGLKSFTHISGAKGTVGSKSEMVFIRGKKEQVMIETVTHADWPNAFHAGYDADGAWVGVENFFDELPNGQTRYRVNQEFKFDSWVPRLLGKIAPGIFKKGALKNMNAFKDWAEHKAK